MHSHSQGHQPQPPRGTWLVWYSVLHLPTSYRLKVGIGRGRELASSSGSLSSETEGTLDCISVPTHPGLLLAATVSVTPSKLGSCLFLPSKNGNNKYLLHGVTWGFNKVKESPVDIGGCSTTDDILSSGLSQVQDRMAFLAGLLRADNQIKCHMLKNGPYKSPQHSAGVQYCQPHLLSGPGEAGRAGRPFSHTSAAHIPNRCYLTSAETLAWGFCPPPPVALSSHHRATFLPSFFFPPLFPLPNFSSG